MKRIVSWLFWSGLFVVLLVGMDQFFVRARIEAPVLSEVRDFYLDFRRRLVSAIGGRDDGVAAVIEKSASPPKKEAPVPTRSPRFIYVDGGGQLHFADSLEEIPPPYRQDAQALEQNDGSL